jgi:hypothetical protein
MEDIFHDRQKVLAKAKGAAKKIGAIAAPAQGLDAQEQRIVGTHLRAMAPRLIAPKNAPVAWTRGDSQLFTMRGLEPTQKSVHRRQLNRPIAFSTYRQHVLHQKGGRYLARAVVRHL